MSLLPEDPSIVAPDDIAKHPLTPRGIELQRMMQGDTLLLDDVSTSLEIVAGSKWLRKKLIIGTKRMHGGERFSVALGIENPHRRNNSSYCPTISRIKKTGTEWKTFGDKMRLALDQAQPEIHDHRLRLEFWMQDISMSRNTTNPAYMDVGLTASHLALECYRNWLLRVYCFRLPD